MVLLGLVPQESARRTGRHPGRRRQRFSTSIPAEKVVQPGMLLKTPPGVVGELLNARIGAEILRAAP